MELVARPVESVNQVRGRDADEGLLALDPRSMQPERAQRWQDYAPLAVVAGCTALAATALRLSSPTWHGMAWMSDFMGLYLVAFAMLKLFDLKGFADCFRMYDLLAKPVPGYAYLYPFLELGLGLAYLARFHPMAVSALMLALSLLSSLGVLRALQGKLKANYACMGAAQRVPLSPVALVENLGMAAMAAAMLLM